MLSKLTLLQKGLLLLAFVLLMQLAFLGALAYLYHRVEAQIDDGLKTQFMLGQMYKISNISSRLSLEIPRVRAIGNIGESHVPQIVEQMQVSLKAIRVLVEQNADDRENIDTMIADSKAAQDLTIQAGNAKTDRDINGFQEYVAQADRKSKSITSMSRQLLTQFGATEAKQKHVQERLSKYLNTVLWSGLCVNISGALALTYLFIANIAGRVERMSRNIMRLIQGRQLQAPEPGDDEIAKLDQTFRKMAVALAEAARKERAVVENALDLICRLDADGLFLTANPAAQSILGRQPDDLIGRLYLDFVLPDDRASARMLLNNVTTSRKTARIECRMMHSDGSIVDILLSANWSASDSSFFCVAHSITQRRQLERLKRQFTAMITHDLRNPLTSVLNILDSIAEGVYSTSSEKGSIRIQQAVQNLDRMLRLISDLMEMGQFDTASLILEFGTVSLSAIIQEAVGSVSGYAEQQKISVHSDAADGLIEADRLRIGQVLTNLLANAIKFSPPGASVSIRSVPLENLVRIEITDRGRGISKEDQAIIFEPYKQAQQQQGAKQLEGTGLGLTICKSIVEAHHGAIGVMSAKPNGSTFWVEIPQVQSKVKSVL